MPNPERSAPNHSRDSGSLTTSLTSRRTVIRQLALAGALVGIPWRRALAEPAVFPERELLQTNPDRFWSRLRSEQFLVPEWRSFLNPASLGVMPRPVLKAVVDSLTRGAEYATDDVQRWGYETLDPERTEMADFLGCRKDELAFTHNCTEAMSTIANGLDLRPGDEVLLTNQEHGSGIASWKLKAARYGTTVREVEIPVTPKQPEELTDPLISAIGPRTRVLSFSGITSPTGLILPVRQICQAAREKGVITVLDGAHMDGQVSVNLHDLGCDYFTGSPHKWLFAPPGCGLLYGRGDGLDRLWPLCVSSGWDNKESLRSARFMMIGTNNRSTIDGMIAGVRFLKELGEEVVYQRMHHLARLVMKEAQRRSYLELVTPDDSRFFQAMVSIRFKSDKLDALWPALKEGKVNVIGGQRSRLSLHIHTRPSDIKKFFQVCDRVLAG
ncbi:MAG: aminotransferase class V-fold PLP-dependent enzyme [Pedosphaera sp.]|nr:aminotransferase class V-fold PLP-dependent enzyme [Pedosphaera sp.]